MTRFAGKTVLITGGTSGFGLEAAKMIAAEGGQVAVTGMSQDHLDEAKATLPESALVMRNDASDPDAAQTLAAAIGAKMGKLDGLWLNAGYGVFMDIASNHADNFDRMMNTNVRGPVLQMAALVDQVKDGGAVLLTSSVAPYLGMPNSAVYAATKAADLALARSWAGELAPRNIRVNSVAPGPIETNFFSAMELSEAEQEELTKSIKSQVPLGRFGTSAEVAQVALFLLSDAASYVTGSEYVVDGGMIKR